MYINSEKINEVGKLYTRERERQEYEREIGNKEWENNEMWITYGIRKAMEVLGFEGEMNPVYEFEPKEGTGAYLRDEKMKKINENYNSSLKYKKEYEIHENKELQNFFSGRASAISEVMDILGFELKTKWKYEFVEKKEIVENGTGTDAECEAGTGTDAEGGEDDESGTDTEAFED